MTPEELEAMVASVNIPPVDTWNPTHVGTMDMVIRRDGSWWHEGGEIRRAGMVRLFASILRREEDGRHCLVTPAEKLFITVEDAAFIAIAMHVSTDRVTGSVQDMTQFSAQDSAQDRAQDCAQADSSDNDWVLGFDTNVGDTIIADAAHPISVEFDPQGNPTPYIHVRHGLQARLARSVYYELAERCEEHNGVAGVWSRGVFHGLGNPEEAAS